MSCIFCQRILDARRECSPSYDQKPRYSNQDPLRNRWYHCSHSVSTSNDQLVSATNTPLPSSSSGISTGGKAAIGVVVPIFVVASALVAFWIWRRKKRGKETSNPAYSQVQGLQDQPEWARTELGGGEIAQLHSQDARPEVDGRTRYQLSDEVAVTPELTATANVEPQELSSGPSVRRNPRPRMNYD